MPTRPTLIAAATALALGVLASSCSDRRPLATAPSFAAGASTASVDRGGVARAKVMHRATGLPGSASISATVGPAGGEIRWPALGLTVTFPAGALSTTQLITVTAPGGDVVDYQFQPHMTFNVPVSITQDLRGTMAEAEGLDPATVVGAYYTGDKLQHDPATALAVISELEPTTVNTKQKTVTFSVKHFSGYICASGEVKVGLSIAPGLDN